MAKYLSNKFKTLKVGIDSFSENTTSLNVTGDVKIGTGITISSTAGVITATSFSRYGGTNSQFMMADGSTTSSTFLTSESDTLDTVLGRGNSSTKNLSVGVITATSFSGTASTATVAQGLTGTPSIVVNQITAQNVSVAQTLTYEDVTNIDSVGLVTARSGIHVGPTAAGVATVTTGGNASFIGVVTATTFIGNLTGNATGISSYTAQWILGADGSNNYTFTGPGLTGAENDPTIYLMRGEKYKFTNSMGAHPFRIQSTANGSTGTIYNDGITNNDVSNGTLIWDVQFDAPSTLYYQCTAHGNMGGVIRIISHATSTLNELSDDTTPQLGGNLDLNSKNITGTGGVNITGVVTATSFSGDGSNLSNLPASGITDIVSDTSPQLGGNLDLNSKFITGTGGANITGVVTATSVKVGSAVTLNSQGIDVTGIVTATSFDGSLASGDVATSANSIVLGRVSGGAGSVEELTPAQIRTLLNVADGATAGGGLSNVVEDGTPELGGYLDLNSKGIFGVGVITATSFVGSGANLTALPALTNSKSVLNPTYPQTSTFTVWLAARYNTTWDHYTVENGNFGSGVSADRTGNISGNDVDININVGDTLILDTATQASLNNAAGPTSIKTTPGTGTGNRVSNPTATNNGTSSSNITWTPNVAGTYYYQNENRVNMRGQIIVSPTASPPASRFISDINFNSEGRVVGVVTFNGINAATKSSRGIIQIHDDPNLTVNTGIVSITQSLNLTGVVTAASFSGSGIGLTGLPAANLTGQLPVINAANLTNLSSSQLTGALPAISGAALTGIQYTGITTINGQLFLNGMSKETINIVANKLSAAINIELEDGLVHYFSTTETADTTPNIRFSSTATLNSKLSVGDSVTVTVITSTNNTNYSYEQLRIDGNNVTEQWIGGAPPGGGSSGYDIYTYQIIKTADATYLIFANKVNFT